MDRTEHYPCINDHINLVNVPSFFLSGGGNPGTDRKFTKEAGLKPHRIERYLASDDPDFESKAADIIGLYLNLFCVDEKAAIQALDRLDRVLPLSPGRAERHGFEYYRHGTLSLYAVLDAQSGKVLGKTAARHSSQEFVEFLTGVFEWAPAREVHIILDNLSAHKSQVVRDFLATHANVHFHFTQTYSSWLNQSGSGFPRSSAA